MFYRVSKCVAMTITLILSSLPIVCVCVCAVGIFCDRVLLFFPAFKLSISAAAVVVADQLSLVCVLCFDNLLPAIFLSDNNKQHLMLPSGINLP